MIIVTGLESYVSRPEKSKQRYRGNNTKNGVTSTVKLALDKDLI